MEGVVIWESGHVSRGLVALVGEWSPGFLEDVPSYCTVLHSVLIFRLLDLADWPSQQLPLLVYGQ